MNLSPWPAPNLTDCEGVSLIVCHCEFIANILQSTGPGRPLHVADSPAYANAQTYCRLLSERFGYTLRRRADLDNTVRGVGSGFAVWELRMGTDYVTYRAIKEVRA